jgi:hypothetical protein
LLGARAAPQVLIRGTIKERAPKNAAEVMRIMQAKGDLIRAGFKLIR